MEGAWRFRVWGISVPCPSLCNVRSVTQTSDMLPMALCQTQLESTLSDVIGTCRCSNVHVQISEFRVCLPLPHFPQIVMLHDAHERLSVLEVPGSVFTCVGVDMSVVVSSNCVVTRRSARSSQHLHGNHELLCCFRLGLLDRMQFGARTAMVSLCYANRVWHIVETNYERAGSVAVQQVMENVDTKTGFGEQRLQLYRRSFRITKVAMAHVPKELPSIVVLKNYWDCVGHTVRLQSRPKQHHHPITDSIKLRTVDHVEGNHMFKNVGVPRWDSAVQFVANQFQFRQKAAWWRDLAQNNQRWRWQAEEFVICWGGALQNACMACTTSPHLSAGNTWTNVMGVIC